MEDVLLTVVIMITKKRKKAENSWEGGLKHVENIFG
jgi:hypothetical protein